MKWKISITIVSLVILIGSFFGPFYVWSHMNLNTPYTPENWLELPIAILMFIWLIGGCWAGWALCWSALDEWMDKS